jgi:hypothetical protein
VTPATDGAAGPARRRARAGEIARPRPERRLAPAGVRTGRGARRGSPAATATRSQAKVDAALLHVLTALLGW